MAGGRTPEVSPRRTWVRCLAACIGVAIAGLVFVPAAVAQLPPVPDLPGIPGVPGLPSVPDPSGGVPPLPAVPDAPDVPPLVYDVIEQAKDVIVPVLVDAAIQGGPVANAAGFALRPACAGAGTAVLLVVIAGGALPVSPGFLVTPALIFCGAAFDPGPADPVFQQVDDAVGPTFSEQWRPVRRQIRDALAPVRPNLVQVCGAIALAGSTPNQVPKPLHRIGALKIVC